MNEQSDLNLSLLGLLSRSQGYYQVLFGPRTEQLETILSLLGPQTRSQESYQVVFQPKTALFRSSKSCFRPKAFLPNQSHLGQLDHDMAPNGPLKSHKQPNRTPRTQFAGLKVTRLGKTIKTYSLQMIFNHVSPNQSHLGPPDHNRSSKGLHQA